MEPLSKDKEAEIIQAMNSTSLWVEFIGLSNSYRKLMHLIPKSIFGFTFIYSNVFVSSKILITT